MLQKSIDTLQPNIENVKNSEYLKDIARNKVAQISSQNKMHAEQEQVSKIHKNIKCKNMYSKFYF